MLKQAREQEQTEGFKEEYTRRAGVEGTIAQALYVMGARHNRYRGLARTHLQHSPQPPPLTYVEWLLG